MNRIGRFRMLLATLMGLWVVAPDPAAGQEISVTTGGEVNVYVAEAGDNLWDIADRFFDDPWYWPTLWSFNPHITNPNWIFPGDLVYLVPPKPVAKQREGYTVSESRYSAGPQVEQALARRVGFISEDQHKGSGEIVNSREEKVLLSETDEAYVKFATAKRVKVGDLFLVYRVEGKVYHPVTDRLLGYKVRFLGITKVTSTEKPMTKIILLDTNEEIERSDRVAPFAPVQRMVPPVRNAAAVAGNIVLSFVDANLLGEYAYVVVDRGLKDGVVPGNRFLIRERGDGIPEKNPRKLDDFPYENHGEILIVESNESTSLGISTYANREFEVGAPCDMLAGY